MKKRKLFWFIFPALLSVVLVSIFAITWFTSHTFQKFYLKQVNEDLRVKALLAEEFIFDRYTLKDVNHIKKLTDNLSKLTSSRITVILPTGEVVSDSSKPPELMGNLADRPEFVQALNKKVGKDIRFSTNIKKDMMFVAIPVMKDYEIIAIVRTSIPVMLVKNTFGSIYKEALLGSIVTAFISIIISLFLSRKISSYLIKLEEGAKKFAGGNLDFNLPPSDIQEIDGLSNAMNSMAFQLNERIGTILHQKNEQDTIFSGMSEGVIAVDKEGNIVKINDYAACLFEVRADKVIGSTIDKITSNNELQELVYETLKGNETTEKEVKFSNSLESYVIQVHCALIPQVKDSETRAIFVLNDITKLKELENIRRDFVSKVSHEIRTPLTSIRGSLGLLVNGVVGNIEGKAVDLLDIAHNNCNFLIHLINDILDLEKIEAGKMDFAIERQNLMPIVAQAINDNTPYAQQSGVRYLLENKLSDVKVDVDKNRLTQVVINLLSNAVKFSPYNGIVTVSVFRNGDFIRVAVTDHGPGIPEEFQSKVFEKFAQEKNTKSNKKDSSGLGLNICKSIIEKMNGKIGFETQENVGTTFYFDLPEIK